jgi:hypothetical protein
MITALKQYGTNYARRTVRRQVINYAIGGVLVITGVSYRLITGHAYPGSGSDEPTPVSAPAAAERHAPAPAPAPAAASMMPQGIDINAPKRAAQKAVAAENAQLAAQTGQAVPTAQVAPVSGPGSSPSGALPAAPSALPAASDISAAAAGRVGAPVTREIYTYAGDGRRDPFFSLILTDDLRPLLADLRLVGILYQASGGRAVAIMRDVQTNAQYRVANGTTLGRMRVTQIRPRAVMFTIDEFGLSRQDSLVWSDTTKVRN